MGDLIKTGSEVGKYLPPLQGKLKEKRYYGNLVRAVVTRYPVGWVNILYVWEWMSNICRRPIDKFTYDLFAGRYFGEGSKVRFCLSARNINIGGITKESDKWMGRKDRAIATRYRDKKSLRLLTGDGSSYLGVEVVRWSDYDDMKANGFRIQVAPPKVLKLTQSGVYLGGNILKILDYIEESMVSEGCAGVTMDYTAIYDAFKGCKILCSEEDAEELRKRSAVFAVSCEVVDVDESVVAKLDSAEVMNMLSGDKSFSTTVVSEEYGKIARVAFQLTLGYNEPFRDLLEGCRKGAADNDFMLVASGELSAIDLVKTVDIYAAVELETEVLLFTSAGFVHVGERRRESYEVTPFSGLSSFVCSRSGDACFSELSNDSKANPFCYLVHKGRQLAKPILPNTAGFSASGRYSAALMLFEHSEADIPASVKRRRTMIRSGQNSIFTMMLALWATVSSGVVSGRRHMAPWGGFAGGVDAEWDEFLERVLWAIDNTPKLPTKAVQLEVERENGFEGHTARVFAKDMEMLEMFASIEVLHAKYGFKPVRDKRQFLETLLKGGEEEENPLF